MAAQQQAAQKGALDMAVGSLLQLAQQQQAKLAEVKESRTAASYSASLGTSCTAILLFHKFSQDRCCLRRYHVPQVSSQCNAHQAAHSIQRQDLHCHHGVTRVCHHPLS